MSSTTADWKRIEELAEKDDLTYFFVQGENEPELHRQGHIGPVAVGCIGSVPYHRDCGDPDCDCYEIYLERDSEFRLIAATANAAPDMAARLLRTFEYAGQLRERSKSLMQQVSIMGLKHSDAFEVRAQCLDDVARELLALLTGEEGEGK